MRIKSFLAAAVACACSGMASAQFSSTIFFGDSLTDAGYFKSDTTVAFYGGGKFTTNPGPVWSEVLASYFGTSATPNNVAGGTNYAQGGARVADIPGVGSNPPPISAQSLVTQVSTYLAGTGGHIDPNALYVLWGGGNDVFAATNTVSYLAPITDPVAYLATAAAQLATEVAQLKALGARYVVVPNLPNAGLTPGGLAAGPTASAGLTALSVGFNQLLAADLSGLNLSVIPVDTFTVFNDISATPGKYGFTNATDPACVLTSTTGPGSSSLYCSAATLVSPTAASTYVFADGAHPTTATHALIAHYIEALVVAPSQISLLAESAVKTRRNLTATLNDQITASSWSHPTPYNVWMSGGTGNLNYDRTTDAQGASGNTNNVTVGIDTRLPSGMIIGGAATWSQYHPDFSDARGGYKQDETVLSIYTAYASGPLRLNTTLGLGTATYETHRNVTLGSYILSVPGNTKGSNLSVSALGSLELGSGAWSHGPTLSLEAQSITVKGFAEANPLSAGLAYQDQDRHSAIAGLGYRASFDAGLYLPFARVNIEHEYSGQNRTINVNYLSQPGPAVSFDAASPATSFGTVTLGVVGKVSPHFLWTAVLNAVTGQSNVRSHNLQIGATLSF